MKNKGLRSPQSAGIVIRILTMKPKKPNSAIRKIAKVKISRDRIIRAYIPGESKEKDKLTIHSQVLIRGGRTQDLPGIKYKIIRFCW